MEFGLRIPRLLALAAGMIACAILFAALPANSAAAGCRSPLKVSDHKVRSGDTVRLHGRSCAGKRSKVHIKLQRKGHWKTVARTRARGGGKFRNKLHLKTRGHGVVKLQALGKGWKSKIVKVQLQPGGCPLDHPGVEVDMAVNGCKVIASDTSSQRDARGFWGNVECGTTWGNQDLSRAQDIDSDGDSHVSAAGGGQGNSAFRRLTVFDGDDYSGERCELGRNDHSGPVAFYHEGQRRATYLSLRLPSNFPLGTDNFQTVMQMKQAQPANNGGGIPILFMGAYENQWHIESSEAPDQYWRFPAQAGVWTRFAFDVFYSQDPAKGSLQVSADLNDDGDFNDSGERSPVIHGPTLKAETAGSSSDGLSAGDSIPDHLRTGIYHDPSIPCPAPSGCSIDVDNVQVLAP
jgi:hypothetical protein